jgi:hypothetical protein
VLSEPRPATGHPAAVRPSEFCRELLVSLETSEGRRTRRKRDTTPDAIGLSIKRGLLENAIRDDPEADRFEEWLLEQCLRVHEGSGGVRAMALSIWDEWQLVSRADGYREWLAGGSPSDDRVTHTRPEGAR